MLGNEPFNGYISSVDVSVFEKKIPIVTADTAARPAVSPCADAR